MSEWECEVCGHRHTAEKPPERCPVCDAPEKMFVETKVADAQEEDRQDTGSNEEKRWRCTVCGYEVTAVAPPDRCPVCDAPAEMFEMIGEDTANGDDKGEDPERRWRCTVCGYIHIGDEPPEKCPVCDASAKMFVEIDSDGKPLGEPEPDEVSVQGSVAPQTSPPSFWSRLGELSLRLHFHPISTHFPNGVLPVAVVFLVLATLFNLVALESAAFFNMVFVLLVLPVVLLTGFVEWQLRYGGAKTALFIAKLVCALIVIGSANILVFWRLLDPDVITAGSAWQFVYLGLAVVMLGATGIAGHLGGKLVFGRRN